MACMQAREVIEELIENEVKGLCGTCTHAANCVYLKTARKQIIQCELYELDVTFSDIPPSGLCRSCDHSTTCKLPGRVFGVWHCNEFL